MQLNKGGNTTHLSWETKCLLIRALLRGDTSAMLLSSPSTFVSTAESWANTLRSWRNKWSPSSAKKTSHVAGDSSVEVKYFQN